MKTLEIELPNTLAARLEELVEAGWFTSDAEIGRLALEEFVHDRQLKLQKRFLREDIAWVLGQKAEATTSPDRRGERERFVEAVEEELADAGWVISDEDLGATLDEELGPLETADIRKRLRKDRPMTTVSLRMAEDVMEDLKHIAPRLGFTSFHALLRAYVEQGLRRHLKTVHEGNRPPSTQEARDDLKTGRAKRDRQAGAASPNGWPRSADPAAPADLPGRDPPRGRAACAAPLRSGGRPSAPGEPPEAGSHPLGPLGRDR